MALEPGDKVGRYRLVHLLGEGAMGRVWRADGPAGQVAVKLLTKRDDSIRTRFDLEAQALLKLRHPHVVRALDYGHAPDGTPFIAMEILDGRSVEEQLDKDGPMSIAAALAMGHDAARGLASAHQMGIVHRDVKPANLFLCDEGITKVLDFGIALWEPPEGQKPLAKSRLTQPGSVLGTPSYMAPEQARGERNEDARTDVWGLCAVLYDVIVGQPPFYANNNNLAELVRILTDSPDPLPGTVPAAVSAVIMRGLERAPEDRFQTMAELAASLAHAMGDRDRFDIVDEVSEVGGALVDEVRMVSAVLVDGVQRVPAADFEALAREHGGVGSLLRAGYAVAVFGAESRTGDEAIRATRMALAARRLKPKRVGIGTGKGVRRVNKRGLVTGQAIAAAQQAIQSVTSSKYTTLKAGFTLDDDLRPPVGACPSTQKRIADRFTIHGGRVLDEETSPHSRRPRQIRGAEVPFVGRHGELAELIAVLDDVRARRSPMSMVVSGPPGIGKSRLGYELLRRLQNEPVRVLKARGDLGQGQGSLGIMRDLLRPHIRPDLPELASFDGVEFIDELLGEPATGQPVSQREHLDAARSDPLFMADRMRAACAELLRAWATDCPVVVLVDDAQWADTASLDWLEWLGEELVDAPLFVVILARPAFFVGEHAFMLAPVIELDDLDDEAVTLIVRHVLGRPERAVIQRASGNPYFAEELALAVHGGADLASLPVNVEGAVQARLDKLAPDEKDLLKRASVLGRRFWQEGIEVLGEPDAASLLESLRHIGLVAPEPDSMLAGCQQWRFVQSIVQETCHGMLTIEQRRTLHRTAAGWLSRWPNVDPQEVASHFDAAREPTLAGFWWIRAITQAHGRGDAHNVIAYGKRLEALDGHAVPTADFFDIQLLKVEALYWLGERDEMSVELDRARAMAEQHPNAVGLAALAMMWRWHARHMQQAGHIGSGLVAAKQAVRLAEEASADSLLGRCRGTLAVLLAIRGDLDGASEMAESAMAAVRGGGLLDRAHAAHARGYVYAQCGHHFNAVLCFRKSRNICVNLGAVHEGALNDIAMARSLNACGDFASAYMLLSKAEEVGGQLGLDTVVGWAKHHLGIAKFASGEVDGGLADEDDALAYAQEKQDFSLMIAALQARSRMRSERGHHKSALDDADRARALTHKAPHAADAMTHGARASALVGLERFGDALAACDDAFDARQTTGMAEGTGVLFLAHHDALKGLGRNDEARATLLAARRFVEAALSEIRDDSLRHAFTQNLPHHRRLMALLETL